MRSDFWSDFAPYSYSIGFIDAKFESIVDEYCRWTSQAYPSASFEGKTNSISDALEALAPTGTPPTKELLITTNSVWTGFFDNSKYGTDAFSSVVYLSELLRCRGVIVKLAPYALKSDNNIPLGMYGAVQFEFFSPQSDKFLHRMRAISLINDGGEWRFDTECDPLPFEEIGRYRAPKLIDRFDRGLLEAYCQELGIIPFDIEFYGNRCLFATLQKIADAD